MSHNPFIEGIFTTISVITPIGPMNMFLLRQGIAKRNILLTIFSAWLMDIIIISLGVLGIGEYLDEYPNLLYRFKIGGVIFLLAYSVILILLMFKETDINLKTYTTKQAKLRTIILAFNFSFLNPFALLDLVVLGTISADYYELHDKMKFLVGGLIAALLWISILVLGGKKYSHQFKKKKIWNTIQSVVVCIILYLAYIMYREL